MDNEEKDIKPGAESSSKPKQKAKATPLRGKKAAELRKAAEAPQPKPLPRSKEPSAEDKGPAERKPKVQNKKRTPSGAKNRTPSGVKKAMAEEKRAAALSQKKSGPGRKRPATSGQKPDGPPASFSKFAKKSNPRVEKKNDSRKQKMLFEEQKKGAQFENIEDEMRLNRYIALSGICSRREADNLVLNGKIKVNGVVTKEMGLKVTPGKDKIEYNRKELRILKFVYLLMNKPKNTITTTKDELGRNTVMELVEKYTKVRVYPVGRLDRNTTGLILFTNDGDLAKRLTHPSHKVKKMYHVRLDKDLAEDDLLTLRKGIELEDGPIKPDKIDYVEGAGPHEVGVELHSGRNRIVRRMFEHLGYEVASLDRVKFGPLSKKNLPRGTCRFLEDKEIGFLKMSK